MKAIQRRTYAVPPGPRGHLRRRASGWLTVACVVLSAVVPIALATSPASAERADLIEVRLSEVVRSVYYAPQYVALAKGFFEEEGLSVDLSTAWGSDKGAAALLSGSVDVGFFGAEAGIYVYDQGARDHFLGFAQLTRKDGSFVMARQAPEGDFRWEDVRGSAFIGARAGGVPQMALEWVLKNHGIDPETDLQLVQNLAFEAALPAFSAGLGDYIAQFEPAMSQMERDGIGVVVASIGADAGDITATVYHARASYVETHPDVLQRFTNAIYKGQQWTLSHTPEEIVDVVKPFFPGIENDVILSTVRRYMAQQTWTSTPQISPDHFSHLQELMIEAGELEDFVPFDQLMTNRFADRAVGE